MGWAVRAGKRHDRSEVHLLAAAATHRRRRPGKPCQHYAGRAALFTRLL